MNLPNPPTDNLYKFVAIFGLVLFIASIYLYSEIKDEKSIKTQKALQILPLKSDLAMEKLNKSILQREAEENNTSLNSKILMEKETVDSVEDELLLIDKTNVEKLDKRLDLSMQLVQKTIDIVKLQDEKNKAVSEFNKNIEYSNINMNEIKNELERIDKNGDELADYYASIEKVDRWSALLSFSGVIGFFMMILGFYFWYVRVQKYQDIILVDRANSVISNNGGG